MTTLDFLHLKPNKLQSIGVFDSGMGGLTVLRQLMALLPNEHFIYLGDTARLPYGTKSRETVIRYSLQNAKLLIEKNIKLLVIACNTASSVALTELQQQYPHVPIVSVLEPGAQSAVSSTRNRHIAVLATETTINTGGYQNAIRNLDPMAVVITQSCSTLVALAEEGWINNKVAKAAIEEYLTPMQEQGFKCDCVVLGCTHFPVFKELLRETIKDNEVCIIDSGESAATVVKQVLSELKLKSPKKTDIKPNEFLVTDSPQRFIRTGKLFLNQPIVADTVTLIENHYNLSTQPTHFFNEGLDMESV